MLPVLSPGDVWRSLDMFIDYRRRYQVGWHYGWLLTHGQGADPTTVRPGSVDHNIPESVRWRLML